MEVVEEILEEELMGNDVAILEMGIRDSGFIADLGNQLNRSGDGPACRQVREVA